MTPDPSAEGDVAWPLRRIAIVNRGEAAMRLINAVQELRDERSLDITIIALHTAAESAAMFVREADEAICLDDHRASGPGTPYLELPTLERALVAGRADAVWVGWGFVAERPEFADLCTRLGIIFIGPTADVMRRLGDKIGAKLLAEQAAVPVSRWSGGPVVTLDEAVAHAAQIGYPLMIKATSGGGGRGIRRVDDEAGLGAAFESARAEGHKAFGDATVFMERVVTDARHVEVQIIGDLHGTVWAVGVRDCSIQRRNQKVIEESHCTVLTPEQDRDLRAAAVRLAQLAGYHNAGTVEFLYRPASQEFTFLEVNTRLQVEHPVTELTTGLDLVKLQLDVAAGRRLEGEAPSATGYAIEARLNAEDPSLGFTPAPGTIDTLTLPVGPGIRIDTGVAEGDVIPPEYDSMIAKVIASGRDRNEALSRLRRALAQMTVVVRGGTTNKSFLLELLNRPEVRAGLVDTQWLDGLTGRDEHLSTRHADAALVVAAIDASDMLSELDCARFLSSASRGRPQVDAGSGHQIELGSRGHAYRLHVRLLEPHHYEVELDRAVVGVRVDRRGRARSRFTIAGRNFDVVSSIQSGDHIVDVDGVAHTFSRDDTGTVRAPAAALVVAVDVSVGDVVEAGSRLVMVEAMKMEIGIAAPISGRVAELFVTSNTQVDAGAPLVRIEPAADGAADAPAGTRLDLIGLGATATEVERSDPAEQRRRTLAAMQSFILGYDTTLGAASATAIAPSISTTATTPTAPVDPAELGVLHAFADLCAVSPEPVAVEAAEDNALVGTREYFNTYLRSLDLDREGLPASFTVRLLRALAHYGIDELDRCSDLEAALLRIFVSQQRRLQQVQLVTGLLAQRLAGCDDNDSGLRDALDRVIETTQRRFPAVASLARGVRHNCFDRPQIDRARAEVRAAMHGFVTEIIDGNEARHMDELVGCPFPILPLLAQNDVLGTTAEPVALLEILTRRYYKIRELSAITTDGTGVDAVLHTSYDRGGRSVHVIAARAHRGDLGGALGNAAQAAATVHAPSTVVIDLYVTDDVDHGPDGDLFAARARAVIDEAVIPAHVRRIACVACRPGSNTVEAVTFRRAGGDEQPFWMGDSAAVEPGREPGFEEDTKFRGMHPMVARRLQMWRLSNFEFRRVPSAGDTYLFDCTAREASGDRRLVAVAEVRDLTPIRDADGRAVALPEVENVLVHCLDSIRGALGSAPTGAPTSGWNRIMLYVWPIVELSLDDVADIARRLAPLTEGLGIEQVVVSARFPAADGSEPREAVLRLSYEPGRGLTFRVADPPTEPMQPLDDYARKLVQTRRRGLVYPYELIPILAGAGGTFVEHDLDPQQPGRNVLMPVDRPPGQNRAGIVVGVVNTPTDAHDHGIVRVVALGDPTRAMGSITEDECRRLLAAIDLAESMDVPIDWFALSAGAKISMDSGSENLDWVARVLRRLVEHTQRGGEVNIVVAGINVGAQPYWNAESTMLMHTKGILVMTPDSAMVLTGKQAIDYSGGVSAEDNLGIGGYARVMGPNGESQHWAPNLAAACDVLLHHHRLTTRVPGERWPRRVDTNDPLDRDVRTEPQRVEGVDFNTVGETFSSELNHDRKKPFDIHTLMNAIVDHDHAPLERWPEMAEAEMAVIYDARLGGYAVTMIGIESRPLPRHGQTPTDGPAAWSAGTLFPLSSKKVARAINAASGSRPVVVLANLSGFDGSPESLRRLQLEYGAEIGRAIVNFDGPIVLCVVSRYHGGAFVVFSATLNDAMEVIAVEGSFASVIGGAPAAAVVFTGEVDARTRRDPRVTALEAAISASADDDPRLRSDLQETLHNVRAEKLGEVAAEFDAVHSVQRALAVGSVHRIIAAADLRPELVAAVERGMQRTTAP